MKTRNSMHASYGLQKHLLKAETTPFSQNNFYFLIIVDK